MSTVLTETGAAEPCEPWKGGNGDSDGFPVQQLDEAGVRNGTSRPAAPGARPEVSLMRLSPREHF